MVFILIFLLQILALFSLSRKIHNGIFNLFLKLTRSKRASVYFMALLFLPGTFLHEMSHFLAALFLLVPVGRLEIIPTVEGDMIKLGSVGLAKTDPIRRFLIGTAPFFAGTFVILLGIHFLLAYDLIKEWFIVLMAIYLIFSISNTMFMSKKDMEGSWKVILLLIFVAVILYILGLDLMQLGVDVHLSGRMLEILKTANLFLLVPVSINLFLSWALKR